MTKNKTLKELKKLYIQQKEKYKITEQFSYRFDYKTKKLILCYTLPKLFKFLCVKQSLILKLSGSPPPGA